MDAPIYSADSEDIAMRRFFRPQIVLLHMMLVSAGMVVFLAGCPVPGTSQTATPHPAPGTYFKFFGLATQPGQTTVTPDGGLFIAGSLGAEYGSRVPRETLWAARYDDVGLQAWATTIRHVYRGPEIGPYAGVSNYLWGGARFQAYGAPTEDGGGAVLGFSRSFEDDVDAEKKGRPVLAKLDAAGKVEWRSKFGSAEDMLAGVFARDPGSITSVLYGKLLDIKTDYLGVYLVEHAYNGELNSIVTVKEAPTEVYPDGAPLFLKPNIVKPMPGGAWLVAGPIGSDAGIAEFDSAGHVVRRTQILTTELETGASSLVTFDIELQADGTYVWGMASRIWDALHEDLKGSMNLVHLDADWQPLSFQRVAFTSEAPTLAPFPRDIAVSGGFVQGVLLNRNSIARITPTPLGDAYAVYDEVVWIPFDDTLTIRPDRERPFIRRNSNEEFVQTSVTLPDERMLGISLGYSEDGSTTIIRKFATHIFEITPEGQIREPF